VTRLIIVKTSFNDPGTSRNTAGKADSRKDLDRFGALIGAHDA
jgi:hypothetical protein